MRDAFYLFDWGALGQRELIWLDSVADYSQVSWRTASTDKLVVAKLYRLTARCIAVNSSSANLLLIVARVACCEGCCNRQSIIRNCFPSEAPKGL